jgi:hypothetical protein
VPATNRPTSRTTRRQARAGASAEHIDRHVDTALAVAAAPDRFKAWWAETPATLPDDFELPV